MKRFKWNFFLLTFYNNFLRVPLRRKVLKHFSIFKFCAKGNTLICQFIIWLKVIEGNKKTSQRHSSKFAQPQNLEKERKLNIFFNISLDLEDLCGAPFYFSLVSAHVSFGKSGIMRFTLDKWFEKTFLSLFDNWVKKVKNINFGNKY